MKKHLRFIFLASFFFSLHMALLAYVNSSMLGQFASSQLVSITYALASILSLVFVTIAPNIVRVFGVVRYMLCTLLASAGLLYLISTHQGTGVIPLFILYFSLNSLILYGLDLFLEHYSAEAQTGNIRGLYLTIGNIGWVAAPILSAKIKTIAGFPAVYVVAAIVVLITGVVVYIGQRGYVDKAYTQSRFIDGIRILRKNKIMRKVTILNFLLQFFFVIMVIYSPIYLTSIIGFSWSSFGIILSVMLLPFVIFPYPAGYIADKYLGERKLIRASMIIIGFATIYFARIGVESVAVYAAILFLTRMGASVMETMCDSAFFKQVTDADSSAISLYRNMMPVAYIIGPLIGAAILSMSSYHMLFTLLGTLMIIASIYTSGLSDSKPHQARQ